MLKLLGRVLLKMCQHIGRAKMDEAVNEQDG
jgi:hypothetical protein